MIIEELSARSFRTHAHTAVTFRDGVNVLCGPNGSGKTNLLEAIHYLCLAKSFVTTNDQYALRREDPFFEVEGRFGFATSPKTRVRLVYVPREGKQAFVNGARLEKLAQIVGRFPVVVLSPDDHTLTAGGPEERRRFLDNILSQSHPVYLADLMTYRRALKQRNALLRRLKSNSRAAKQLEPWTNKLVEMGSRLVERRCRFVETFVQYLEEAYMTIESVAERPTIDYRTFVDSVSGDTEAVAQAFRKRLAEMVGREAEQTRTLVGPHRDELVFRLDGMEVRRYASHGQHRTFALALKLAQYLYIRDAANEQPLLLLDDVLDNLDPTRREAILLLLQSDEIGQSIVTASDNRLFDRVVDFSGDHHTLISMHPPASIGTG